MKIKSHTILGTLEATADKIGKGSVFRACIAFQRSCPSEEVGNKMLELGYKYLMGKGVLSEMQNICIKYEDSNGEFREAIRALQNSIEMI